MKKLSTGANSTLGEYLKLSRAFFGIDSAAVKFLQAKIAETPNGENEEVIADEGQMIHMLSDLYLRGTTAITTEEEFETLKPIKNHLKDNAGLEGTMFETYGAELDFVMSHKNECVWTYLDGDDGLYLSNGFHSVNRLGYVVTELPYFGPDTEICMVKYDDEREMEEEMNEEDKNMG